MNAPGLLTEMMIHSAERARRLRSQVPTAELRRRVLVDNPARLYDFPTVPADPAGQNPSQGASS